MADIFISYSSKDRDKAEQLTELLASAGLSVWIDQQGIGVATSWSKEIVDAIDECKALVLLLSSSSVASINVAKELSLAAERGKKILPLDLEPVALPNELAYHLAGIQRAPMTNIDAIVRAIGKLGVEATQAPTMKLVKETDSRKSLMILPFEDLSPTADNQWFTDGIVSELIQSLSNVKALRLMDAQTTKEFKSFKGQLTTYAREMSIRYFVQGDVRKFGDNIKINSRLLDIETGDHLWQDSLKGTMDDIFDIQETVAKKVVDGLQIILTKEEETNLDNMQTQNPEAQEFYFKGNNYHDRATKVDFERALTLYEEAIRLDPNYIRVHLQIASTALALYSFYGHTPIYLERAKEAAEHILSVEGESTQYMLCMSRLARAVGDYMLSLHWAERAVEIDPLYELGYDAMGHAFQHLGKLKETADAWTELVRLRPNDLNARVNLLHALRELGDTERLREVATVALPFFERHARLAPDDLNMRVDLVNVLGYAGRREDSIAEADILAVNDALDGKSCYNLACHYMHENLPERGMNILKLAIKKGFRHLVIFKRDPDLDPLRGTPEFEALMKELEEKLTNKD